VWGRYGGRGYGGMGCGRRCHAQLCGGLWHCASVGRGLDSRCGSACVFACECARVSLRECRVPVCHALSALRSGSVYAYTTQHTTHNTQHTTHNTQHTTHNTDHTTHNTQHTTHNTQHRPQTTQHTTHNTQHTTHTTHHTPHTTHHTKRHTPSARTRLLQDGHAHACYRIALPMHLQALFIFRTNPPPLSALGSVVRISARQRRPRGGGGRA
jgi:hypothetical protein